MPAGSGPPAYASEDPPGLHEGLSAPALSVSSVTPEPSVLAVYTSVRPSRLLVKAILPFEPGGVAWADGVDDTSAATGKAMSAASSATALRRSMGVLGPSERPQNDRLAGSTPISAQIESR